jgi:hypothetical protein
MPATKPRAFIRVEQQVSAVGREASAAPPPPASMHTPPFWIVPSFISAITQLYPPLLPSALSDPSEKPTRSALGSAAIKLNLSVCCPCPRILHPLLPVHVGSSGCRHQRHQI